MTKKRKKHTPARCVADGGVSPSVRPWLGEPVVVVIVVVVVAAFLVEAGLSAQAALELATGGLLLGLRLRQERA